jgi:hypothetical protein
VELSERHVYKQYLEIAIAVGLFGVDGGNVANHKVSVVIIKNLFPLPSKIVLCKSGIDDSCSADFHSIMTNSSLPNFANQDLRNRSFKGQNLNGADFSASDIRGCDFSYALLRGANFEGVRAGQSLKQLITLIGVVVVALLAVDAFSQMIFGVLGRAAAEGGWSFVVAFYISLAIAGTFCGARVITGRRSIARRVVTIVSGAASGALLGFFYAGSTTKNNPKMAIAGAVVGGLVIASAMIFRVGNKFAAVAVAVVGLLPGMGLPF